MDYLEAYTKLYERYTVLFDMYVAHIHEHRLGAIDPKNCTGCNELAEKQIEAKLEERSRNDGL
jgi:hypothetical protein